MIIRNKEIKFTRVTQSLPAARDDQRTDTDEVVVPDPVEYGCWAELFC